MKHLIDPESSEPDLTGLVSAVSGPFGRADGPGLSLEDTEWCWKARVLLQYPRWAPSTFLEGGTGVGTGVGGRRVQIPYLRRYDWSPRAFFRTNLVAHSLGTTFGVRSLGSVS